MGSVRARSTARWAVALGLALIGLVFVLLRARGRQPEPAASVSSDGARPTAQPAPLPPPPLAAGRRAPANPTAPARPAAAAPPAADPAPAPDGGTAGVQLFGSLVRLGQGLALAEALAKNAAAAEANLGRFCEENERLQQRPAVHPLPTGDRDAAAFLAPLVDWEAPLDDPPGRLHLPDELRARLNAYGAEWPLRITDADLAGLDFGWLAQLAAFDRWSLLAAGRLRDRAPDFFNDPIPNYLSLQQWSKLRYALGLRRGDLQQASAEVLHLADLMRTQGILIAEMVALVLYRFDARAREVATAAAPGADLSGWQPSDLDQLGLQRRMGFAGLYFTYPGVSPETVRKAMACMAAPCSALIEGAGANRAFGQYGASDNLELVRELARARGCEEAAFERAVRSREVPAGEALNLAAEDLAGQLEKQFVVPPPR